MKERPRPISISASRKTLTTVLIVLGALSVVSGREAVESHGTSSDGHLYEVTKSDGPITVDGRVDEAAWATALRLELAYETFPAENAPAPVRTDVLVTYDDSTVYFAFRAFDPDPSALRAQLSGHDSAWRDDRVGVVLDTFNDQRRCYMLMVNPLGSQMDFINHAGIDDIGWDAIWGSAGTITTWGWMVEIAVPFRSLRFQRRDGPQLWGFNALRQYPRDKLHWLSVTPEDRGNDCRLCQISKIRGFENVAAGRNVEIVPAVTTLRREERAESGGFQTTVEDVELGVTGSWGLTPNITLTGTLNPDFSQVEADALQLDVNEPFALFFGERRPFFTEASDFFHTPMNAVHTRTIRDPSWGLKITGKQGGTTVAGFVAEDALTHLILPGSQSSRSMPLAIRSLASVLRLRRDLHGNSAVGVLVTAREGREYFNRVAGIDGDFRLSPSDRITLQVLTSSTSYPDSAASEFDQPEGQFDDIAARLSYARTARNLSWFVGHDRFGPGFRADLGYLPQVGYSQTQAGINYNWILQPGRWWSSIQVNGSVDRSDEDGGGLLQEGIRLGCSLVGTRQFTLSPVLSRSRESYGGKEFQLTSLNLWSEIWPTRQLAVGLGAVVGDQIDYANVRLGRRLRLNPVITWRIGRHLRLGLDHKFERMVVAQGRLYSVNVSRLSSIYHFSLRSYVRAVLQYFDRESTSELFSFPVASSERWLFTELLFSYQLNPRTVAFVGYGDSHAGDREHSLVQQDRSWFAKLSYAWLL